MTHRATLLTGSAILGLLGLAACGGDGSKDVPDTKGTVRTPSAIWFEEVGTSAGLAFEHSYATERRFWMPEAVGSGIAFVDADEDGFQDLYAIQAGDLQETTSHANVFFHNAGNGTFEDTTDHVGLGDRGYGMGVACGDFSGDGKVDIYVTNVGPNTLYRNKGDGTFADVTEETGTGDALWGTSTAFLDYDRDGDLDLFVTNYLFWRAENEIACNSTYAQIDYCSPRNYNTPTQDLLLRNENGQTFKDVSVEAGFRNGKVFGNGLGVAPADFDGNGYVDIYIANDLTANRLWNNQGDGTFLEDALLAGCAVNIDGVQEAGMGVIAHDFQNDGDFDLFMTHLRGQTNTFYLNHGGGSFVDSTTTLGLATPSREYTGFGVGFGDFDQDGIDDLFIANGRVTAGMPSYNPDDIYAEPNQVLRGIAGDSFQEVPDCGLETPVYGNTRGAAFGDYDNDGDVDIACLDNGSRLKLLRNVAKTGNWMQIRALKASEADDLGAVVRVGEPDQAIWRQVQPCFSFCSSNDIRAHFGLGKRTAPQPVMVRWSDGVEQEFAGLEVNRLHVLKRK